MQFAPAAWFVMFAGQAPRVGDCVSVTVTVNEQLGEPPDCEQVTVVVPTLNDDPEGGEQVMVPQVPPVVGAKVTTALHCPAAAVVMILAGQVRLQFGIWKYPTSGS